MTKTRIIFAVPKEENISNWNYSK